MPGEIVIKGARQHNLKNVDLAIPRDKLVVLTGVSGSGKSSLAFDTLCAEGRRRYVGALSVHARRFLEQTERAEVDSIEGLPPTIALTQDGARQSPRSTVGTMTEIYDFLRLLFARVGKAHCLRCGRKVAAKTIQQVVDELGALAEGTSIHIQAPISGGKSLGRDLEALIKEGFTRVKIDGEIIDLGPKTLSPAKAGRRVDLVVDRLVLRPGVEKRLADSLATASRYGGDRVRVEIFGEGGQRKSEALFSQRPQCAHCGGALPEITPRLFSFNSPDGACRACGGLGVRITGGAANQTFSSSLDAKPCASCAGARLRKEALSVKLGDRTIADVAAMPVGETEAFFAADFAGRDEPVTRALLPEITRRLKFLTKMGLDYLSLDRSAATLSLGEAQRVRIATEIGSGLAGILYVLDEPTIGLHPGDNVKLFAVFDDLLRRDNTLLVVEHDPETILRANYVIELGPGAGDRGGSVVAAGTPDEIQRNERSLTGQYLAGRRRVPVPERRRDGKGRYLVVEGARHNNLKGVDARIPVGTMTCVTGVSGSGKSSLVMDVLCRAMAQKLNRAKTRPGRLDKLIGWEEFDRVISVDRGVIGKTPRSNASTYTGILDHLRALFAKLPEARIRGFGPAQFSFNNKGGRCEACAGDGVVRVEMYFLADLYVTCEICGGARYNRETLAVRYRGMSIAQVLDLTVDAALEVFFHVPPVHKRLEALRAVGLGYLKLGQPAPSLSGGEAQRIKLAAELGRDSTGRALYILDEPTSGLHFEDVRVLLRALEELVDGGNTVVMIEHNLDVIKSCDYILDLGPGAGHRGGEVIAEGTPEQIAQVANSITGRYLRSVLS
jgi:excinuclease ABC subunit A